MSMSHFIFARQNSSTVLILLDSGLNIILQDWKETNSFVPGLQVVRRMLCQSVAKPGCTLIELGAEHCAVHTSVKTKNLVTAHDTCRRVKEKKHQISSKSQL